PLLEHMHGCTPCAFGVVYERPVPVTCEDRRAWAVGLLQPPRPAGLGRSARCAHVPSRRLPLSGPRHRAAQRSSTLALATSTRTPAWSKTWTFSALHPSDTSSPG